MVGPKVGRASSSSALSWIAVVALASGCPGPSGGEDAGPSAADAHTLDDAPVIDAPVVDASGIDAGSGDVGTHDAGSDAAAPTDAPPPTPDAFFAPS
ncbi:MAG: hypothetical protein J0L92_28150, partial [Deltaproteobacteria bacterium]|nr:hypothetical protein [Deltaproteobacteria bacterium]